MDKKITLWTSSNCEICKQVKNLLKEYSIEIFEKPAGDLITGDDKTIDAMTQLAMQDMALPVIMFSSEPNRAEFIKPQEIQNYLKEIANEKTVN